MNSSTFKPGDRVRITSPTFPDAEGIIIDLALDPMDDSTEPSPHGAARDIIREEILYRLKGAESHARACASDHGETFLASQADKAADVLTARLASFTDVLEPAGRPSREDVARAIWNAEGLDRAVLTDCWEIAGKVLDLYPELDDLLGPCPSEGAEPAQDLPVIAYGDIPEGATYEMRQRWVKKGVMSEPVLGDARYHLVSAPEPEPDAELVAALAARMEAECACMSMDDP